MPDARFYVSLSPLTVADLASLVGGDVVRGGDRLIQAVAPLALAGAGMVAYLADRKHTAEAGETRAEAAICSPALVDALPPRVAIITSREAQAAWARAAGRLHQARDFDGVAGVHPDAILEEGVVVGPGAVVGARAEIGAGTRIGANTVIGPGVAIGRNCQIGSNVSIHFALLGDRIHILAGARIGETGFGAAQSSEGPVDIPQLGRVILQDGVTIGANSCVDRGGYGDTVLGENTKVDNLVMIGHNCQLGRNCLIAAHTGISGSVIVGDNAIFGGKAGVGDHLSIGEGARVAAGAGVLQNVAPGETVSGYPARPLRQFLRETVWLSKQAARRKGQDHE
jgi:UDP-3-O-[3-hydroxymyristoyl] glucosamine N-acyltransferase